MKRQKIISVLAAAVLTATLCSPLTAAGDAISPIRRTTTVVGGVETTEVSQDGSFSARMQAESFIGGGNTHYVTDQTENPICDFSEFESNITAVPDGTTTDTVSESYDTEDEALDRAEELEAQGYSVTTNEVTTGYDERTEVFDDRFDATMRFKEVLEFDPHPVMETPNNDYRVVTCEKMLWERNYNAVSRQYSITAHKLPKDSRGNNPDFVILVAQNGSTGQFVYWSNRGNDWLKNIYAIEDINTEFHERASDGELIWTHSFISPLEDRSSIYGFSYESAVHIGYSGGPEWYLLRLSDGTIQIVDVHPAPGGLASVYYGSFETFMNYDLPQTTTLSYRVPIKAYTVSAEKEITTYHYDAQWRYTYTGKLPVPPNPYDLAVGTQRKGNDARLIVKLYGNADDIAAYDDITVNYSIDGKDYSVSIDGLYTSFINEGETVTAEELNCTYVAILEIGDVTAAETITATASHTGNGKMVIGTTRETSAAQIYSAWR